MQPLQLLQQLLPQPLAASERRSFLPQARRATMNL
jgi:hypothetical protein